MKKIFLLLILLGLLSGCYSTEKEDNFPSSPSRGVDIGIGVRVEDKYSDNYFQVDKVVFENNYLCIEGDFKLVQLIRNFHPFTIYMSKNYDSARTDLFLEVDLETTCKENEGFIVTENYYTLEGKSKLYYKVEEDELKGLGNCEFLMDCMVTYMGFDDTRFYFFSNEIIFK